MGQRSLLKAPPRYTEAFERFWKAYPARRPNPKALAAQAFTELERAGEDPEEVIRAARRFAAECERLEIAPAYIPHARTWLSQRRFEDYMGPGEPEADGGADPVGDPLYGALDLQPAEYRNWIEPLRIERGERGARIHAPSRFHADWVRKQYADRLRRALADWAAYVERIVGEC